MNPNEFTHQEFFGSNWEDQVKSFIETIDCSDNVIWHRKRKFKKINEELATLGYYVKYHYGVDNSISFKLNAKEGKADGWVFKNGREIEIIQIAIAFYEQEEAEVDRRIMEGVDVVVSGWVGDRLSLLENRVEKRILKKTDMNYSNIDTLVIGVRGWFVRRLNSEYLDLKASMLKRVEPILSRSKFKQAAIVDSDYVGIGECVIIPNKSFKLTPGGTI